MLMKKIVLAMCTVMALAMMSACGTSDGIEKTEDVTTVTHATEDVTTATQITEDVSTTTQSEVQTEASSSDEQTTEMDVDMYVGTYNDYDNNEPNLKISLNEDGTYSVIIGIFRLILLEDGVGTLTDKGLKFVATDAAGNPIEGVITVEGDEAVVTFTNSTWELIENGTSYRYVKASDI